jgi:hypothetical protein
MDFKYGSMWGGWCSHEIVGVFGVGLWKSIKNGRPFPNLLDLRWGMGVGLDFDMICGAEIRF